LSGTAVSLVGEDPGVPMSHNDEEKRGPLVLGERTGTKGGPLVTNRD
jgi:hypothetical protein